MTAVAGATSASRYRHAAVFYAGLEQFLATTLPFIRAGVAADEPTLVVVAGDKIEALRSALGGDPGGVEFADMGEVGSNPAHIIPAWRAFADAHPGRRLRGIGEPIDAGRGAAELVECQHHERLLNPALDDCDLFLICPYDTASLPPDVIAEARRSHPLLRDGAEVHSSDSYDREAAAGGLFDELLPEPAGPVEERWFDQGALPGMRMTLRRYAEDAGLGEDRTADLVLATGELATNSIRYGGGHGVLRFWREESRLICEIRDGGRIDDPLIDRRRPVQLQFGGWGLWIANQACDLLQLRSRAGGTVARVHMHLG